MANTYTWSLNGRLYGDPSTGVVRKVDWRLTASDPTGAVTATRYGEVALNPISPGDPSFVPLTKLTTEQVITWGIAALGANVAAEIAALQAALDAEIAAKLADATPLTWSPDTLSMIVATPAAILTPAPAVPLS